MQAIEASAGIDLVIPTEIESTPVTAIDAMPESPLSSYYWKSVSLPASLTSIDYRAIPKLRSDEGFSLQGDSNTFSVIDGVLFSANGRELVAFSLHNPQANDQTSVFSYEIPAGTKTVGVGAFNLYEYGNSIDIGSDMLRIGANLTSIGQATFSSARVTAFEVDSGNNEFSSVNGLLMSKDRKTLLI